MNSIPEIQALIKGKYARMLKVPFREVIQKDFDVIKQQLILEFLNHPVTQEISDGPNAKNTSGTLGGKGNLFSFIGFDGGDDPIEPILDRLQNIQLQFSSELENGVEFSINIPTAAEIFAITPMPWNIGRSWAKGIESGISGLNFYLYAQREASRSGQAIQTSKKLNDKLKFKNTQYISALLAKYRIKFSKLK